MKYRTGFVSNSSSSSFILGYGVIKDMAKFKKAIVTRVGENELRHFDSWLSGVHYLYKHDYAKVVIPKRIEGGNYRSIPVPEFLTREEGEGIVLVRVLNDEGDSDFWDESMGDMNYEKAEDIDYYPKCQQELVRILLDKDIVHLGYVKLGAERNG